MPTPHGLLLGRYGGLGDFSFGNTRDFTMTVETADATLSSPFFTDGAAWYATLRATGSVSSTDGTTWASHTPSSGIAAGRIGADRVRVIGGGFYTTGFDAPFVNPAVSPSEWLIHSADAISWDAVYRITGAGIVDVDGDGAGEFVIVGTKSGGAILVHRLAAGVGTDSTLPAGWGGGPARVVREPASGSYVIAGVFQDTTTFALDGYLIRSTDGGVTFSDVGLGTSAPDASIAADLIYSPQDAALYYGGGSSAPFPNCLIRSTDGGATWTTVATPFDGAGTTSVGNVQSIAVGAGTLSGTGTPIIVITGQAPDDATLKAYVRPLAGGSWTQITATAYGVTWPAALGGPAPPFAAVVLPPLRQFPRDDALGGAPRQGKANGSTSIQGSTRQGWRGTYR